jgi:uncharacterized DUF497 family protein
MWVEAIWDLEDEPDGNVQHIAEHGVSIAEVEEVLHSPIREETSRSSGRPLRMGWTSTGRLLAVIYEVIEDDPLLVYPVTAFDVERPEDQP